MNEQIILSKLYAYLKKKNIKYKKIGRTSATLECIFCKTGTMQVLPNTYKVNCFACKPKETLGHYYTLIDIARKVNNLTGTDDDILQHIKEELKINVMTKKDEKRIDNLLDFYKNNNFALIAISPKSKIPIEAMKGWTEKEYRDMNQWKTWIANGLNLGLRTGFVSNNTSLDIDVLSKKEKEEIRSGKVTETREKELMTKRQQGINKIYGKYKNILGNPLVQETIGGCHLIYQYENDLPKTNVIIEKIKIDIENDGGYILIEPSTLSNTKRYFKNLHEIPKMSKELLELLKSKITKVIKTDSEEIREDINTEDFKIDSTKFALKNNNLDGCCNAEFIKLGGILRKKLNPQDTGYVLNVLNKHMLAYPMNRQAMNGMIRELSYYTQFDEQELAHKIVEYLKDVEEANRTEIAMAIVGTNRGEDKKRVDKVLKYLVKEGYVIKKGARYSLIKKPNWKENLINIGIPIDFKMPYFDDVMYFNWGDLILIGSANAKGKTHISMNIIKRLVAQGKKPCYLSLETGSRWAKIALQLGLKEGDFKWDESADATEIELDKGAITVIDWLCPANYAEVDKLLMYFTKQLQKTKGIAIIFMQLREDNNWLAKDLVKQFPSFTCKYIYDNKDSGEYGKFVIDKIREAKLKTKAWEIPCRYDWEKKTLTRIDEENEKEE